jgi:hypothetical protein
LERLVQKLPTAEKDTHKQEYPIETHWNQFSISKSHFLVENRSEYPHITSISRDNDGMMNTSPTKHRENVDPSVVLFVLIQNNVESKFVEMLSKLNPTQFHELQRTLTLAILPRQGFVVTFFGCG